MKGVALSFASEWIVGHSEVQSGWHRQVTPAWSPSVYPIVAGSRATRKPDP